MNTPEHLNITEYPKAGFVEIRWTEIIDGKPYRACKVLTSQQYQKIKKQLNYNPA